MTVCSTCGCVISRKDGACQDCNQHSLNSLRLRQAMDSSIGKCLRSEPVSPIAVKRTKQEWRILETYMDLKAELVKALDRAIGCNRVGPHWREPCSGNTAIWKDDESGASGGWDRVVRLYEEGPR